MIGNSKKLVFCATLALVVTGCARTQSVINPQTYNYEGYAFKAKVQGSKEDRADFAVSVRGADRGVPGALEAARIEGNRYCIKHYGNTDISWSGAGPETDPAQIALPDGGVLELQGRCSTW